MWRKRRDSACSTSKRVLGSVVQLYSCATAVYSCVQLCTAVYRSKKGKMQLLHEYIFAHLHPRTWQPIFTPKFIDGRAPSLQAQRTLERHRRHKAPGVDAGLRLVGGLGPAQPRGHLSRPQEHRRRPSARATPSSYLLGRAADAVGLLLVKAHCLTRCSPHTGELHVQIRKRQPPGWHGAPLDR